MTWRGRSILPAVAVGLACFALIVGGCDWFGDDGGGGGRSSKFVFVANTQESSVSIFRIHGDGTLTSVDNVLLADGSYPTNIALHPRLRFVYIVNSTAPGDAWNDNASIGVFAYNPDNGAITEIEGSPFAPPLDETGISNATYINMAITPNGRFLYAGDVNHDTVDIYSIDQKTGALTLEDSVPVPNEPHGIAVHRSGDFLFASLLGSTVCSFVIHDNGALTAAPGSPLALGGTASFVWLAPTPNGRFLYAAGISEGAGLSINTSSGELTLLGDIVDTSADGPKGAVVTPNGRFLYSANFSSNSAGAARIASDGMVDNVAGQPFPAGTRPKSVTVTRSGRYLYVANFGGDSVSAFEINGTTGVLTSIDTYPVGAGPKFLVTLP